MVDDIVTVKGSPVRSLQKFFETELDAKGREAVFAALPPEYADRFRAPILSTETIPLEMLNRITEEAAKAKGEPLEQFARRAGRAGANDAVRGIYRFFVLVLTPAAILARVGQMWTSMYNRGELQVLDQTDHSARIRFVNFPSVVAQCARFTGWIEQMAELTGAKDVTVVQTQCLSKGGACCEWQLNWR